MKIGGSLARNGRFGAPTCLFLRVWFSSGLAVSMGEAAKFLPFVMLLTVKIGGGLVRNAVFLHPRVLSRVADFPVVSFVLFLPYQYLS